MFHRYIVGYWGICWNGVQLAKKKTPEINFRSLELFKYTYVLIMQGCRVVMSGAG